LQLFVIPAVIVTIVVLLWMLLAGVVLRRSGNPDELIKGLTGTSADRWQNAQQLADMLRDERYADFKKNESAAAQLAQIIQRELRRAAGGDSLKETDVTLLMFVARAVGEFHVDTGLPALIDASEFDGGEETIDVRRSAIQAIAVLTSHMQAAQPGWNGDAHDLEATLLELAGSDDRLVRSDAAFALGVLGTPAAIDKLAEMVRDPYPDARFNAATALARHGDLRAVETLAEMIDPAEDVGLQFEDKDPINLHRRHKRRTVLLNAVRAAELVAQAKPTADFQPIERSLQRLVDADAKALDKAHIEPVLVSEGERLLRYLQSL
jgi:HEAT repeat protein